MVVKFHFQVVVLNCLCFCARTVPIAFVKINDEELADEYNLDKLPALVYYRNQIPIV